MLMMPRPPHTQQVEFHDMIPKGSFPVPLQKEQVTSALFRSLAISLGICSLCMVKDNLC